jgi:hypothetical protein
LGFFNSHIVYVLHSKGQYLKGHLSLEIRFHPLLPIHYLLSKHNPYLCPCQRVTSFHLQLCSFYRYRFFTCCRKCTSKMAESAEQLRRMQILQMVRICLSLLL